jgi:HEPN domain-containing protein
MKKLVKDWLTVAERDLLAARKLLDTDSLTNVVTFHCHQSIEKAFKTMLLAKGGEVPRIHNLITLWGLLKGVVSFQIDLPLLEAINEAYIDTRYPSDIGLLPNGVPSKAKAMQFADFAGDVLRKISKEIS